MKFFHGTLRFQQKPMSLKKKIFVKTMEPKDFSTLNTMNSIKNTRFDNLL